MSDQRKPMADQREAARVEPDAATSISISKPLGPYFGEYDERGVDISLLRYMLELPPLERLKVMERHARDTRTLNEYGRRHREAQLGRNQ